jgi:hypothetical protein
MQAQVTLTRSNQRCAAATHSQSGARWEPSTQRYDDREDFLSVWVELPEWRPWAESPVAGEFHIPVRMPPNATEEGLIFVLDQGGERVSTSAVSAAGGNGPTSIERGGDVLYRAAFIGNPDNVRVGFENACWDGRHVRADLRVSAAVGIGGDKGYQFIQAIPIVEPRARINASALGLDVRRVYRQGVTAKAIVADVVITAAGDAAMEASIEGAAGEFRSHTRLVPEAGALRSSIVRGVPLNTEISVATGDSALTVPGAKLAPRIVALPNVSTVIPASEEAIRALAEAIRVTPDALHLSGVQVVHVNEWNAALVPWYLPVIGGRVMSEEDGIVSEALNRRLTEARHRHEVRDAPWPAFKGKWDLETLNGATENQSLFKARHARTPFAADKLRIQIRPEPAPSVTGIRATFTGQDDLGVPVVATTILSRYALKGESVQKLADVTTEIACKTRKCDDAAILGRTRAYAISLAMDLFVTADELATLLDAK